MRTEEIVATPRGFLRLFVYGTLKRGYWNHDRFCRSASSIEEATVRGQLYEMPSGIPVLMVSGEDVLALGTANALDDVATQESKVLPASACGSGDYRMIRGELLTFSDPRRDLPPIDRLESYRPGFFSLYSRVLVPVSLLTGEVVTAWAYAGNENMLRCCKPLEGCLWPAGDPGNAGYL